VTYGMVSACVLVSGDFNGDGTFQTGSSYPDTAKAISMATGDGNLDLVTNTGAVLLGNGNGTFHEAERF
jgi:hypothetical protein